MQECCLPTLAPLSLRAAHWLPVDTAAGRYPSSGSNASLCLQANRQVAQFSFQAWRGLLRAGGALLCDLGGGQLAWEKT
jgi:hypothetical protein